MKKRNICVRNYFFIIFLIIFSTAFRATASVEKTDSLRQIIENNPSDKEGVDAMLTLAKDYRSSYMSDSARSYAERAREISNRINYAEGIAGSNLLLCIDHWTHGRLAEAQAAISVTIQYTKQIHEKDKLGKAYYHQAVIFGMTGETDSAIYYFKASLALTLEDSLTIISDYVGLGNVFKDIADYDSSIYYHLKAAKTAELSGKRDNLGLIYGNIGVSLNSLEEYVEAEKYYKLALEISLQDIDTGLIATHLISLGGIAYRKKDNAEALAYLDQAYELLKPSGDTTVRSDLWTGYGLIYKTQGKYDLALTYYNKALNISKLENDPAGIIIIMINLGDLYTFMGQYDKARSYLDSGMSISIDNGYLLDQMEITRALAQNSDLVGNYKQAYEEHVSFFNLYDSVFKLDKARVITELKQKYEKEKDQARIFQLEKESLKKTLQRNLILFNSSALLVAGLFFLMILRHKLVKTRMISEQKIRQLEEEKKMMMARNLVEGQEEERKRIALELHDGLGVILSATKMQFTSIKDDIPKDHPVIKKAIHMIEQATGEVRRISHNMMPGLLTKLGLYEAVEDLMDTINEMEDIRANIEIEGDKSRLPENNEIMIYRIIQEMVNNTLKYAKAGRIDLSIVTSKPFMMISYKDDGIGFDVNEKLNANTSSLGLKSIESRVVFLNGELKIDSTPGKGVNYLIKIPV